MQNYKTTFKIVEIPKDTRGANISKNFDGDVTKSLGYGEIEVVVSNDAIDRHGESIMLKGIDLTQIKRNPTLLWAHDYSKPSIGRIDKIYKSQGNLKAKLSFDYEIDEFADLIYKKILKGSLNAVSLGGIAKEFNDDYTVIKELEMYELSVVPVGAHRDALVTSKSSTLENRLNTLEKQLNSLKSNSKEPKKKTYYITY